MKNKTLPTFDYSKGKEFTTKLKETTGCNSLLQMATLFDVPKATFSTWNLHQRTSHELMVRLMIHNEITVDELKTLALTDAALEEHLQQLALKETSSLGVQHYPSQIAESLTSADFIKVRSYKLENGKLSECEEMPYPTQRIKEFKLENANLVEIVANNCIYLIDKNIKDAMSGTYLIDIDQRHSINSIQRLPKKLVIEFDGTSVEIDDEDINVIGKVVVTIKA